MFQHTDKMANYPRPWTILDEHELVEYWRRYKQPIIDYREGRHDLLDLSGTAIAGRFDGSGESRLQNIMIATGYVVVDYDNLGGMDVAAAARDLIGASPHTRVAVISKSGDGVHVIVKVGRNMEIVRHSWYSIVNEVIDYYDKLTGLKADRQASGIARVIFDTWDPELIYKPDNVFPLSTNRVYNGEERRLNTHTELTNALWPRVFGAAYSLVKDDLERDGRIHHETIVLCLLPLNTVYAESMIEFLTENRTGHESWGVDELESLARTDNRPLGLGSLIYAAKQVDNLYVESESWLTEKGWVLKVQFDNELPWSSVMPRLEQRIEQQYNRDATPRLIQAKPQGLRWLNKPDQRVGLGDIYKILGETMQYRRGMNVDSNPPAELIRMCEHWSYETLPEIDRIANTARVVDGRFYGSPAYLPSRKLLLQPERNLIDALNLEDALNTWEDYCGQFAFSSKHSKRNLLLLHMSPLLRSEAYGWSILLVTKPNRSVGGTKALQAGWYALHTAGFSSPSIPMQRVLGARMVDTALASDRAEVYLDNIYTLNYVTLKNIPVNAEVLVDPKMQKVQMISTRNLTVFADGINVSLDSEMRRRVLVVQLTEEEAIKRRLEGYRHPVIIRDIQQNHDFTDCLLSLANHYTRHPRIGSLPSYIDSLEEFTEVAYSFLQMCYGTDDADEWLEQQLQEAETSDVSDEELGIISALQLGWTQVFQNGERSVKARDLLYWIKTDASEQVETFETKYDKTHVTATSDIVDVLKRGQNTSLNEFTWQLKDAENRLFEVDEGQLVKLQLTHQRTGANRGTWCQLVTIQA